MVERKLHLRGQVLVLPSHDEAAGSAEATILRRYFYHLLHLPGRYFEESQAIRFDAKWILPCNLNDRLQSLVLFGVYSELALFESW